MKWIFLLKKWGKYNVSAVWTEFVNSWWFLINFIYELDILVRSNQMASFMPYSNTTRYVLRLVEANPNNLVRHSLNTFRRAKIKEIKIADTIISLLFRVNKIYSFPKKKGILLHFRRILKLLMLHGKKVRC